MKNRKKTYRSNNNTYQIWYIIKLFNFEQILGPALHKIVAVLPPTSHLSKINKTCGALLEIQE